MSVPFSKKEKILIEYVLSDTELFIKCFRIIKPEYFEKPLDRVVSFAKEYFSTHKGIPDFDIIEAETDVELKHRDLDPSEYSYVLEEFETHCRDQAFSLALLEGVDLLEKGENSAIQQLMKDAMLVKIDDRLGTSVFENAEERIKQMQENIDERSCGIPEFDALIGKLSRGELGIFAAPTSGGKSLFLANFTRFLSEQGLNCLVISIEMNEDKYSKRFDTILTGISNSEHAEKAKEVAEMYEEMKKTYGDIMVKRVSRKFTVNDLRAFIQEYIIFKGFSPDVLVVDYIDIMGVEPSIMKSGNKFDIDEYKSQELRDMCFEHDMYGFTAAQLNREGYDIINVGPQHIAGGLSKVNASDWTVAIIQTEDDMNNNQFQIKQMKIRNNDKDPKPITLYLNTKNLRISGKPDVTQAKFESKIGKKSVVSNPVSSGGANGKSRVSQALSTLNKRKL